MEKVHELSDIIKSVKYTIWCKEHYFPNINKKVLVNATKEFDPQLNPMDIAAIIDTSLSFKCKTGTIYTRYGLYDRVNFEKPFFVRYDDIEWWYIEQDKKGNIEGLKGTLVILMKDDSKYTTNNEASAMKQILDKIMPVVRSWDEESKGRESGSIGKHGLTDSQIKKCHAIIHSASVAAGGVGTGLAQIPLSDNALITPIQIAMITSLGGVMQIRISEGAAKGLIGSLAASFVGRSVSQVLVGWIPVIGNAINTATAAGITEAVGWAAVKHFTQMSEEDRAKYRIDSLMEGYKAASDQYEEKLKKQADEFLKQQKLAEEQFEAYEQLIKEYEEYIDKLEKLIKEMEDSEELNVPKDTSDSFESVKAEYDRLLKLKVVS